MKLPNDYPSELVTLFHQKAGQHVYSMRVSIADTMISRNGYPEAEIKAMDDMRREMGVKLTEGMWIGRELTGLGVLLKAERVVMSPDQFLDLMKACYEAGIARVCSAWEGDLKAGRFAP